MRLMTRVALGTLGLALMVLAFTGCDAMNKITTNVSGQIYMEGTPVGGHVSLYEFETGKSTGLSAQSQTGHFIISSVPAGEYVMRYMDMRAIPMGGGMYLKVQPGRPVTELEFEVWEVTPPPQKGEDPMTLEEFKDKFGLKSKEDIESGN